MARIENVRISHLNEINHEIKVEVRIKFDEADKTLKLNHQAYVALFDKDSLPDVFIPFVSGNYKIHSFFHGKRLISEETGDDDWIGSHKWETFKADGDYKTLTWEKKIYPDQIKRAAEDDGDSNPDVKTIELRALVVLNNELNGQVMNTSNTFPIGLKLKPFNS